MACPQSIFKVILRNGNKERNCLALDRDKAKSIEIKLTKGDLR